MDASGWSEYCDAGGLLSYGANQRATYFRLATYADRVLRGENPSDLPVEQYNNPKIQALFKEMVAQEDIPPDIKEEIRYIRSGEGFAEMRKRDFDRQCMRWSEMRSISACVSLATQILRVYAVSWVTP